jgi:hypothetical protein
LPGDDPSARSPLDVVGRRIMPAIRCAARARCSSISVSKAGGEARAAIDCLPSNPLSDPVNRAIGCPAPAAVCGRKKYPCPTPFPCVTINYRSVARYETR